MKHILRALALTSLLVFLPGCAGGWRNGAPPELGGTATAAPSAASNAGVGGTHATADGALFYWKGDGNTVNVAGEFNAWSTSADPLKKQADGSFALARKLGAGRYMYKFVVDGTNWKEDPTAKETADDGFGGKNAVVVVGGVAAAPAAAAVKPAAGAGAAVSGDAVTFKWGGGGNTVNVAGEFNAWSTSADAMQKQADGTFTLTKKLAAGRYQYKFVVDGTNWKEDPTAKETADDGYGGKNAVVVVGGGGTPAAPAAAAAAAPAAGAGAAVSGDAVTFKWGGGGNTVNVAGEFNAWSTSADAMQKQADGSFTLTKKLSPGRYQYKFVVDGTNWKEDPTAKETADDGYGGKNAVIVVGGGGTPAAPAAAAAAAPATGAGAAVNGDAVTFKWGGGGNTVNLAGEFNAWSTSADAMQKQADGSFTLTRKLAAGRYQYKFVVDGTNWKEDPTAKETADDGYGGKNAVIVVGGGAAAAPAAAAAARALAPGAKAVAPQVTAKGVVFTYAGSARSSVALCGDFNNWTTTADPMVQQADGTWTITRKIAAGSYAYKFLVDGATWKQDEGNPASKDDGFGGKNSLVTVK